MSTLRFNGNSAATFQVNTITPVAANNATYKATINGKDVSYLADASATVAEITAGLVAALNSSTVPPPTEFGQVTWTDSTTLVTATGKTAGVPFTQTSSSTGGSNTTATTTTCIGPNFATLAANYDTGSAPVNSDDLIIDGVVPILYSLNLSAVALTSLTIRNFTATIGLPQRNSAGYPEYLGTYLQVGASTVSIDCTSGRMKLDLGSATAATINVNNTGSPLDTGLAALLLKGTNVANVLNVNKGSVGVAMLAGEVATIATWRAGYKSNKSGDVSITFGAGCTLTTGIQTGGKVETNSAMTTVTKTGGTLTHNSGAITTLTNDSGTVVYNGTGTITNYTGADGSVLDLSQDIRALTITNCTLYKGAKIIDPNKRVTWTNGISLIQCNLNDVNLDVGTNVKVTPVTL